MWGVGGVCVRVVCMWVVADVGVSLWFAWKGRRGVGDASGLGGCG